MNRRSLAALSALLLVALCAHARPGIARRTTPASGPAASPQATPTPAESDEAKKLSQQAVELYAEGKYDEALPLARRATELAEKTYGPDHRFTGSTLANLAIIHIGKKQLKEAPALYERVLAIREKSGGPSLRYEATALETYACLLALKANGKITDDVDSRLKRIDLVAREDSIIAQGFAPPFGKDDLAGGKAVSKPAPRYPEAARASRASGSIVMRVDIDETGAVTKVKALDCTVEVLRKPSEEAVSKARFEPTLLKGKPVRVSGLITYNFHVQ